jgi:hypothetical protein
MSEANSTTPPSNDPSLTKRKKTRPFPEHSFVRKPKTIYKMLQTSIPGRLYCLVPSPACIMKEVIEKSYYDDYLRTLYLAGLYVGINISASLPFAGYRTARPSFSGKTVG